MRHMYSEKGIVLVGADLARDDKAGNDLVRG